MIAKLYGEVDTLLDDGVILNVSGVGYFVLMSISSLASLSEKQTVCLYIEHVVRQEAITLYGFQSLHAKKLFQKLTSVQGVGGKSGLSILSVLTPAQVIEAICSENLSAFKKADGVGSKVAARILNELKTYAEKERFSGVEKDSDNGAESPKLEKNTKDFEDAVSTLVQLGYKKQESIFAVEWALKEEPGFSLKQIIPLALKKISQQI